MAKWSPGRCECVCVCVRKDCRLLFHFCCCWPIPLVIALLLSIPLFLHFHTQVDWQQQQQQQQKWQKWTPAIRVHTPNDATQATTKIGDAQRRLLLLVLLLARDNLNVWSSVTVSVFLYSNQQANRHLEGRRAKDSRREKESGPLRLLRIHH